MTEKQKAAQAEQRETDNKIITQNDRAVKVSYGKRRNASKWETEEISITDFLGSLKHIATSNKDGKGFVLGELSPDILPGNTSNRAKGNVLSRSGIALDIDRIGKDCLKDVKRALKEYTYLIYSTYNYNDVLDIFKYRVIIITDRDMSPAEYQPAARKVAELIGIDYFEDDTTFRVAQLMYVPMHPIVAHAEPVRIEHYGKLLSVDALLSMYEDWTDKSTWPHHPKQAAPAGTSGRVVPPWDKSKPPIIRAWAAYCDIYETLTGELAEYFEEGSRGRFSYTGPGCTDTRDSVQVYEHQGVIFNHQNTPFPWQDRKRSENGYDLMVQLKFDGDVQAAHSYMLSIPAVSSYYSEFMLERDGNLFNDDVLGLDELSTDSKGKVRNTNGNLRILVKAKLAPRKDVFSNKLYTATGKHMTDRDASEFAADLSCGVGVEYNNRRVKEAVSDFAIEYHPVRVYLNELKWDGIKRAETIFIDWLGAEDIPGYTRLATRQFLKAMIKRVYEPGCEHQEILVLVGLQGIYKSNILRDLSKGWFMDSLDNPDTKIVGERTAGAWIVELSELKLFKGMDEETKKEFISRRAEKYRPAYGYFVGEYPRQFILAGTTNRQEFLGDYTGDRRYIPIQCGSKSYVASKAPWDHFALEVDQILAEAVVMYKQDRFIGIPKESWDLFDEQRENFRFKNEYLESVIDIVQKEGRPERISVEWLADQLTERIYGEPSRKEKAEIHSAIQRMGGYTRIGKQAKVFGKNTRNGWERV